MSQLVMHSIICIQYVPKYTNTFCVYFFSKKIVLVDYDDFCQTLDTMIDTEASDTADKSFQISMLPYLTPTKL